MTGRATVSPRATRHDTARSQRARRWPGVSTREPRAIRRTRPRTEKSCGPDARGLCVKPCGDVAARPGALISHPQCDGGNSASLPGESTKDTVKTIRAGKAGRSASPVIHPVCISKRTDLGCRRRPAFPAPFGFHWARTTPQSSGNPVARVRGHGPSPVSTHRGRMPRMSHRFSPARPAGRLPALLWGF